MRTSSRPASDIDASVALFELALPKVYGYLLHRCRSRALAEDLTSESILAAVVEVRRGRVDEVNVAWLIGIARHKLADHWRRADRESRRVARFAADASDDVVRDPLEPGPALEALAGLRPLHRAALTLRHIDGLAVPEVASVVGRSVHATETLLVRARAAFKKQYGGLRRG